MANRADADERRDDRRRLAKYRRIRAYTILALGVFMVIWSFVPPIHPAVLTLGGALIGFDPMLRSAAGIADGP
jgi:hypothetical protein